MSQPDETPPTFNLKLHTEIREDAVICQKMSDAERDINLWVMDTRQKGIRDALIQMGWTPPPEPPAPE